MKYRTTKKAIKESWDKILCVTYDNLQFLLRGTDAFAYSTRSEGWACDYFEIPREICVSTGYAPIGKHVDYNLCRRYDEAAEKIWSNYNLSYDRQKQMVDGLLADFAGEVDQLFKKKGKASGY